MRTCASTRAGDPYRCVPGCEQSRVAARNHVQVALQHLHVRLSHQDRVVLPVKGSCNPKASGGSGANGQRTKYMKKEKKKGCERRVHTHTRTHMHTHTHAHTHIHMYTWTPTLELMAVAKELLCLSSLEFVFPGNNLHCLLQLHPI